LVEFIELDFGDDPSPVKTSPKKPKPRSAWQRFKDAYIEGAVNSEFGGAAFLTRLLSGRPEKEVNAAYRRINEDLARKRASDEEAFKDADTLSPTNIGKLSVDLLGNIAGGVDPTYILGPGKTVVQRILAQGGINAGADAASQGIQISKDIRDEYDPYQTLLNAGAGVVFQGAGEAVRAARAIARGEGLDLDAAVGIGNKFGKVTSTVRSPERNRKVGGVKNSYHLTGQAIDVARGKGVTHKQLERAYRRAGFKIVESLDEGDHSHFAFQLGGKANVAPDGLPGNESVRPMDPREIARIMGDKEMQDALDERTLAENLVRQADEEDNIEPFDPDYARARREGRVLTPEEEAKIQAYIDDPNSPKKRWIPRDERDPLTPAERQDMDASGNLTIKSDKVIPFPVIPRLTPFQIAHNRYRKEKARFDTGKTDDRTEMDKAFDEMIKLADPNTDSKIFAATQRGDAVSLYDYRTRKLNKKLEEDDKEYLKDLENSRSFIQNLFETITKDESPITLGEFREIREEMGADETLKRMKKSRLPALGVDVVEDIVSMLNRMEEWLKAEALVTRDPIAPHAPRIDSAHEKFTPYMEPKAPANDPSIINPTPKATANDLSNTPLISAEKALRISEALKKYTIPLKEIVQKEDFKFEDLPPLKDLEDLRSSMREILRLEGHDPEVENIVSIHLRFVNSVIDNIKKILGDESGSFRPFGRKGYRDGPEGLDEADPEKRLVNALKNARPVSAEQRRLYRQARAERSGRLEQIQQEGLGLAGYRMQGGALKGPLPKVDYESIAEHFNEEDIATLLNRINFNNALLPFEKYKAQTALLNLLGAEGVRAPTAGEIKLLSNVFSDEFISTLLSNRTAMQKFWAGVRNSLNLPRAIMSSFDLSAPFRQGIFFVARKEFWKSFANMFKLFGSERASRALMDDIRSRPTYELMKKSGLALTDPHSHFLMDREEDFMSDWAEKIPLVGLGVKASNRAYSGFLNKLRADVFDDFVRKYEDIGVDLAHDKKRAKDVARFINAASGRGSLGRTGDSAAPWLNNVFFSPRLIASRVQTLNPYFYASLDPVVRKEAVRSLLAFGSVALTVAALAKHGLGMEVETDPNSSDFMKPKRGDTRYDILGGYSQYIVLASRLISGETTTSTGEERDLTEGKYGQDTRRDVLIRFAVNKLSPVASFVSDFLEGKDPTGEPFDLQKSSVQRFIPMFAQDVAEAMEEYGIGKGLAVSAPGLFGVGTQTYKPREKKTEEEDGFSFSSDIDFSNEEFEF